MPTPKWTSPARVDAIRAEAPGHLLFTVLKHDPALRRQERCCKGRPDIYPAALVIAKLDRLARNARFLLHIVEGTG